MDSPLVSIIVITYNSADFVLETLESAKTQTYKNIELIISDDCSTDNTVELCQLWLKENEIRFIRTKLITTFENTGISSNGNRGLHAAKGTWLKYIAGDDILQPNCIKDSLDFISSKTENIECLFAQIKLFTKNQKREIITSVTPDPDIYPFYRANITAKEQYAMLLNVNKYWPLSTPSFFVKKELVISVGGFDERYKYLEDLPLYLKILEGNIKFHFMPKITVMYRIHDGSILRKNTEKFVLSKFQISKNHFIKDYILQRVQWSQKIRLIHELFFDHLVIIAGNKGIIANFLHRISIIFNPARLNWFKRKFNNIFRRSVVLLY